MGVVGASHCRGIAQHWVRAGTSAMAHEAEQYCQAPQSIQNPLASRLGCILAGPLWHSSEVKHVLSATTTQHSLLQPCRQMALAAWTPSTLFKAAYMVLATCPVQSACLRALHHVSLQQVQHFGFCR